jgi:hypothetical protein
MDKIANLENVICSVETMSHHELYHYTGPAGFGGIATSQTLWCSQFGEMIDTDEVQLMRRLLPPAIAPLMDAIVEKENRHTRRLWNKAGRGEKTARDLVNSLYGATFDGKTDYAAFDAYLFSFSTHAADSDFDREHGVPSQWVQYAGSDGYCFVFDIHEMAGALEREGAARYWAWLMLKPVRYADRPVAELFPELVNGLADTLHQFIRGVKIPEMTVPQFLDGSTLLKGATFKSEREIRIVAVPGTAAMAKYAAKEHPRLFNSAAPLPETRTRPNSQKRYIALFEGLGLRFPIKRVIVGPGQGQADRARRALSILGDIPVTLSQCSCAF